MIQVQIASHLTAQGVAGVRWVLVEPNDPRQAPEPPPAVALAAGDAPAAAAADGGPADSTASALRLGALKLLVVALGLGAALWTAHVQVGPPGASSPLPAPGRAPAMPARSTPVPPGAVPLAPAHPHAAPPADPPAAADPARPAASAAMPRLTAAL
jgi:hypothetical protein